MSTDVAVATPQTAIEKDAANSVMGLLKKYSSAIKGALPDALNKDRFAWLVVNNIRTTPELAGCTPGSFINSVMLASNMGLEIRKNSAYLIPFGRQCQLLIDYRGKMDLARRAGVGAITVELVHEYDQFEFERSLSGTKFRHKPLLLNQLGNKLAPAGDRGEVVLGYGMADLGGKEPQIEIMTLQQIEDIRKRSRSGGKGQGPWTTDWDQMARKTIIHRLANYLPQSAELRLSQDIDEANEVETRKQPVAEQLVGLMESLDPADDRPMVDIPDNPADQRKAQDAIAERKIAISIGQPQKQAAAVKPEPKQANPYVANQQSVTNQQRQADAQERVADAVANIHIENASQQVGGKLVDVPLPGLTAHSERHKYTRETIPDANEVPAGTAIEYENGQILRSVTQANGLREWKAEKPEPAAAHEKAAEPKRERPVFGRKP